MSEVMTIQQLSEYLQLPVPSLQQMAQQGMLPAVKAANQWQFQRQQIDAWLHTHNAHQNASVLVVDDDELVRRTFQDGLKAMGCQVTLAEDGDLALQATAKQQFDLIFLDLVMPCRDGIEVLAALRARGCQTPVALITAYPDGDMLARALRHGSITLIQKPINISGIQAATASLLHAYGTSP